jgi:hypothetical protein
MCLLPTVKLHERQFATSTSLLPKISEVFDMSTVSGTTACENVQEGGPVFVFTDYFNFGNYYHLHVDLMLRLFKLMEDRGLATPPYTQPFTLMPMIQREFLKGVDWHSTFFDKSTFGLQALEAMAGTVGKLQPLHEYAQSRTEVQCLQDVTFGLGYIDYLADEDQTRAMMRRYTAFIREQLGMPVLQAPKKRTVVLVSRRNRRRIVNEKELITILRSESKKAGPLQGVQVSRVDGVVGAGQSSRWCCGCRSVESMVLWVQVSRVDGVVGAGQSSRC